MPVFVNWLLRLVITNPICMRLVQGGSRRRRHLFIRSGYLGLMIFVVLFALIGTVGTAPSVRELAQAGAQTFTWISYLQVGLICLLTPIFMAGAIAQEANPRTWDIMLTTPLGNLQIVLGNLFGRLFFILALLFSTLPIFAMTQYFGGVPGNSIFASYAIAASSSLLVAAIAITLCVNRTAGRRAVFWFYAIVVMYLFITYALDLRLREPVTAGATGERLTTFLTPLNPFLALEVLLLSNTYVPHELAGEQVLWITRKWLSEPISTFCWLCLGISVVLIGYSTLRVRIIGARAGTVSWYRRALGLAAKGAVERPPRHVGASPIAWRESVARGKTLAAVGARWGFVALGIGAGVLLIALFHIGAWNAAQLRVAALTVLVAEVVVIALVALNMSATAVSREREDGTLDLILTTPIQPGPYLAGKLRGLVQYLFPLMLVPVVTTALLALYVVAGGFGNESRMTITSSLGTGTITLPLMLPEAAFALPLVLAPFTGFCVIVGLYWSIRSKGTIGSVVAAVLIVGTLTGVVGMCGIAAGGSVPVLGPVMNAFSPVNLLFAALYAPELIEESFGQTGGSRAAVGARIILLIGAVVAAVVYCVIVFGMLSTMKRTFMMTVRKLAGVN